MNRVEFGVRVPTGQRREHGTEAVHDEEIIDMLTRLTAFLLTLRNSVGRMLWVWGAVSVVTIAAARQWAKWGTVCLVAGLWIVVTFLPYSFLAYMPRVPSRHTYLASAGLALLVAAGWTIVSGWAVGRGYRWVAPLAAAIVLFTEAGYIWVAKRPQFLERAEPTEDFLRFARRHTGPIYLRCFPLYHEIAGLALHQVLSRPASEVIIDANQSQGTAAFCYGPDSSGGAP